jgi:AcrR family transcriptional regulator
MACLDEMATVAGVATVRRRRGGALESAIRVATLGEFLEVGYFALTVEAVAARARASKASIYRRWATKDDLVLDALASCLPEPQTLLAWTSSLESDVSTVQTLRMFAEVVAEVLNGPFGAVIRRIRLEASASVKLGKAIEDRFQVPLQASLLGLVERGVARGEVRAGAFTDLVADLLPAMLSYGASERSRHPDRVRIIDEMIVPLIFRLDAKAGPAR